MSIDNSKMTLKDVLYGGVDVRLDGEGGPKCVAYLSITRRIIETLFYSVIAIYICRKTYYKLRLPFTCRYPPSLSSRQRYLLTLHMFIFGMEIGFKLATKSLIWIANPCHVITITQSFLLTLPPSPALTAIYRMQMHLLNGPILAILFPITENRQLPFEQAVYYLQHIMILIIPAMLLKPESPFSVEPLTDFSWTLFTLGLQILYHFIVLQPIGLLTGINMNNMICPGSSDPFAGQHYRVIAMIHQPLMILTVGKIYSFLVLRFKQHRLIQAELNPRRVSHDIALPSTVDGWQRACFQCRLVTESTTSPYTSRRFHRFYYSAIPVSITRVAETCFYRSTFEEMICNQNILFVPAAAGNEDGKSSSCDSLLRLGNEQLGSQ